MAQISEATLKGERCVCVDAPHFYAALWHKDGKVHDAAPILRYMIGWPVERAAAYIKSKGWKIGR